MIGICAQGSDIVLEVVIGDQGLVYVLKGVILCSRE
jgi:hypothetical protein